MKRLLATTILAMGLAAPALAADPRQELSINRTSPTDQISGLVVQGNSIVLVYGASGMASANQAVRITPEGNHLRVVYDTVGNLGVNTTGMQPAMMLRAAAREFPIYNMGATGAN